MSRPATRTAPRVLVYPILPLDRLFSQTNPVCTQGTQGPKASSSAFYQAHSIKRVRSRLGVPDSVQLEPHIFYLCSRPPSWLSLQSPPLHPSSLSVP